MSTGAASVPRTVKSAPVPETLLHLSLRKLLRHKPVTLGGSVLVLLILAAAAGPLLTPFGYDAQNLTLGVQPPLSTFSHPLGTDQLGRDILSRILYGARITLFVSLVAMLLATVVGVVAGVLSGYVGGITDTIVMRIADVQLSFPYLLLAIAMAALLRPSLLVLIGVLVVRGWVSYARTIRGILLSLKQEAFVSAAVAAGAGPARIAWRHILPNALAPIIVLSSFELAAMMLVEASLSFLGLGVQPPMPSWGSMISQGRDYMYTAWWLTTIPGVMLMVAVLAANHLGDGLRDLLDPRLRNSPV